MAKEGKLPRPQDKHLIPLTQRPPEEAHAIRVRAGKASAQKRREQMELHKFAKAVMTLGVKSGKLIDPETLTSIGVAMDANIPVGASIFLTEYARYMETGDKESRDFLMRWFTQKTDLVGTHDGEWPDDPNAPGNDPGNGVRIHLIRGERPAETKTPQATATPNEGAGSDG